MSKGAIFNVYSKNIVLVFLLKFKEKDEFIIYLKQIFVVLHAAYSVVCHLADRKIYHKFYTEDML